MDHTLGAAVPQDAYLVNSAARRVVAMTHAAGRPTLLDRVLDRPWWTALLLLLLALCLYTRQLGKAAIVGDDEARDAAVVSEMAVGGYWLVPLFNGTSPPEKPPLFYWLAALTSRLAGGVTEWSVRFPCALLGAATVALVFLGGRVLIGGHAAFVGAVILMTAPLFVRHARIGRTDMALTFCVTGLMFAVAGALGRERPVRSPKSAGPSTAGNASGAHGSALLAWLWLTLAVLAKGGAALGAAGAGTAAAAVALRARPRALWSAIGASLFLALVGGWHLYAWWCLGDAFVKTNLVGENLNKLLGRGRGWPRLDHWGKPAGVLLGATLPWTAVALWPAVWGAVQWSDRKVRFLTAWVLGGLAFFTFSAGRHSYYALPLLPAFALWLGTVLCRWNAPQRLGRWSRAKACACAVGALLLTVVGLTAAAYWRTYNWWGLARSDQLVAETWARVVVSAPVASAVILFLGLLVGIAAVTAIVQRQVGLAVGVLWAPLYVALALGQPFEEQRIAATDSLKPFAVVLRQTVPDTAPVWFYGRVIRGVVFYSGRHISELHTDDEVRGLPPGSFLVTTERQRAGLRPETAARLVERHVSSARAFNLGVEPVYLLEVAP